MESSDRELECLVREPDGSFADRWSVPVEAPLSLWVNGTPWVTIMCTPTARRQLALGFAYFAGLLEKLSDVLTMEDCEDDPSRISLRVRQDGVHPPPAAVVTSGCGQGLSLSQAWPEGTVPPSSISTEGAAALMRQLQEGAVVHRAAGGTHASALSDGRKLLALYEDIGRHNTLDKLMGHSLLTGLDTKGLVLLTSGRVSSEMLYKAVRMQVSAVISRTTPTDLAVELAKRYGLTLIGYARGKRCIVFSSPAEFAKPDA